MSDVIPAFPLQWPTGWRRTTGRREGRFAKNGKAPSVHEGVQRIRLELGRMGVSEHDIVISTNVPLRLDGWPRSDRGTPSDPGVACYWVKRKKTNVIAIDTYFSVSDNLCAIAASLDAFRAPDRHGGEILDRAFTGFTALPAPGASTPTDWWVILEVSRSATLDAVRTQYRRLASQAHPDKPTGSHDRMQAVNAAWEAAQRERA